MCKQKGPTAVEIYQLLICYKFLLYYKPIMNIFSRKHHINTLYIQYNMAFVKCPLANFDRK
jgi:hypothetical protein